MNTGCIAAPPSAGYATIDLYKQRLWIVRGEAAGQTIKAFGQTLRRLFEVPSG